MDQRRNSVIFDSGAIQIQILLEAFFGGCLAKAQHFNPSIKHYHPVLSDIRAHAQLLAIDSPLLLSNPGQPTEFLSDKLQVLAHFLRASENCINDGGVRLENQRVFYEIEIVADSIALYRQAFSLMEYWLPWMKSLWNSAIKVIVPLCREADNLEEGIGFTNKNFLGGFFISPERRRPDPVLYLNIAFAHELGHQALYVYQFAGPMILEKDRLVYSGVRKVDRPAQNSLHAAMALAYMLEAIKGLQNAPLTTEQFAYLNQLQADYKEGLKLGLEALKTVKLTAIGETVIRDLAEAL